VVMVWCASTEIYITPKPVHQTVKSFEEGSRERPDIAPSMVYAYAAISSGSLSQRRAQSHVDIPALVSSRGRSKCDRGKGLQDGADAHENDRGPGLKARLIGLNDGSRPISSGTATARSSTIRSFQDEGDEQTLRARHDPPAGALPKPVRDFYHKSINYYPRAGTTRRLGQHRHLRWLGYRCRSRSISLPRQHLAADRSRSRSLHGLREARRSSRIQEWLSFYFKSPQCAPELYPEHDLFIQLMKLKNQLRHLMGEELITHLGTEYYE